MSSTNLFDVPDVAELLDVSIYTIRRWIRNDYLNAAKIGRSYKISKPDLEEFWGRRGGGTLFEDDLDFQGEERAGRPEP